MSGARSKREVRDMDLNYCKFAQKLSHFYGDLKLEV